MSSSESEKIYLETINDPICSYVLWGSVGFIILVAVLLRVVGHFSKPSNNVPRIVRSMQNFIVRHFYLSRLAGTASIVSDSWTSIHVPLRVHGLLAGIYVAANLIIIFTSYETIVPNM